METKINVEDKNINLDVQSCDEKVNKNLTALGNKDF